MKPKIIKNPSYTHTVLEMMMVFPCMYPSELACQNSLFLTTSGIEVTDDRCLTECRGYVVGEGDTLIDRTKISILGNPDAFGDSGKSAQKNWEKLEKPYTESAHGRYYSFPLFYPIGTEKIIHFHNWTRRHKNHMLAGDIFNAFLNDEVDLPEDWKAALVKFCQDIEDIDETTYELSRLAYYRSQNQARQYWECRFREDCEHFPVLRKTAREILDKINPPQVQGPPPVDKVKLTAEYVAAKERKLKGITTRAKK